MLLCFSKAQLELRLSKVQPVTIEQMYLLHCLAF